MCSTSPLVLMLSKTSKLVLMDSVDLSVTNITYSDTEDGHLVSYDGGSTLLVGVDKFNLVLTPSTGDLDIKIPFSISGRPRTPITPVALSRYG